MHTDRRIGRSRAACDETDTGLSGQFAICCCHKGRATLVPAQDEIQRTICPCPRAAGIMQRIQHRQIAFTRHTKTVLRAQRLQAFHQHNATIPFCHLGLFLRSVL